MRNLTIEEQDQVSGGDGITLGTAASNNGVAYGNSVDAGGNSFDLSNNGSGNDVTINADTNNRTVDRLALRAENKAFGIVDRIA